MTTDQPASEGNLHEAHYRFLRRPVTIATDSRDFLEVFERDYALLRAQPESDHRLIITARLGTAEPHLRMDEVVNGRRTPGHSHPITDRSNPVPAAYRVLLRVLLKAMREFIILHAGVLKAEGGALLLAGPPGIGKTTLTLSLFDAGLEFFSDDFCPIERAGGMVHAFPRSAWVVGDRATRGANLRPLKHPLPPETIAPSAAAWQPCPPRWVVILEPGGGSASSRTLEIGVRPHARQALLHDFEQVGSAIRLEVGGTDSCAIRVHYPADEGLTAKVRGVLEHHRAGILEAFRDDAVSPDFSRTPILEPISRAEAAFSLLGDLKQLDVEGTGIEGMAESPARLLMELAGLLEGADCFRLTVGRLEPMRDLLLALSGAAGDLEGVAVSERSVLPLVAAAWRTARRRITIEVAGVSMTPLIRPGDFVTLQMTAPDELRAGDVFAFQREGKIVAHRLIMKRRSGAAWRYCEKGDGLSGWTWVGDDAVLGRIEEIRRGEKRRDLRRPPWRWLNPAVALGWSVWILGRERLSRLKPRRESRR